MKTILPLLLALAALPAQAQIYKWTDANGTVHYSDQPQEGQKTSALAAPAAPSSPSQDNWRERERQSRANRQRQELAERRADAAQQAAMQQQQPYNADLHRSDKPMTAAELCQRDRQKIEFAEKTWQMGRTHGNNTVLLTEAERQELIRERKADHAIACPGR